ncbi:class I adenylate-forming enzyme family protein [Lacisediminimonas profundi]|uniref:class I adenylate-forming enzyme family protein n=1 Tax=Lacisediminimonas profundi TaxID=2603856 RepID=UPI001386BD84|nr:AMP-binding protein [Lacisediminimonas profundi]
MTAAVGSAGPVSAVVAASVPLSVVHLLVDAAQQAPDQCAIEFEGACLTWAQYAGVVGALAHQLSSRVRPGDRVALVMQNSLDLAVATFAVHALRAQAVPLNPRFTAQELQALLADADPIMVLHDDSVNFDPGLVCPLLPPQAIRATAGGAGFMALLESIRELPATLPSHDDLATLQYTGGTTGRSKGVNILHRHLAWNLAQREAWLPTRAGAEVVLCVMPLFHVSAVAMSLHLAVAARSKLVIHRRFDPQAVIAAIEEQGVTLMSAAPAVFHDLLLQEQLVRLLRSRLRACYSGAAPLPRELLARFEEVTGCPIYEGYGMSEGGPCLTYNPVSRERKPGSVGLPVPASEFQIVDLATGSRELAAGEAGEIRVRGPHVMAGYRNLPELTARTLRDGWLYTGDVARRDEDGYVFILGRRDDVINVSGFKVYPGEVERALLSHPEVGEAAAFGVPDERAGRAVHAWVTPAPGTKPDEIMLRRHCEKLLAGYKVPRRIGIAERLPRTSVGKLARNELAAVPNKSNEGGQGR